MLSPEGYSQVLVLFTGVNSRLTNIKAGYTHLIPTTNGLEAWNKLDRMMNEGATVGKDISLVITDIEMPQMDGHHLTKRVKNDERMVGLPVVIFSSLVNEEMRRKGERLGADAQLSKPEIGSLIGEIDLLLNPSNK